MVVIPETANSFQGEVQTFNCSAMGGPGNMFSWTRLYDNTIVGNTSNLTVNVSGATDGGQYRCEVSNQAGNESQVTILNGKDVHFSCDDSYFCSLNSWTDHFYYTLICKCECKRYSQSQLCCNWISSTYDHLVFERERGEILSYQLSLFMTLCSIKWMRIAPP